MDRYRSIGQLDDASQQGGDDGFIGVDSYTTPENLPPGVAQAATNMDFSSGDAATRGGFVCIPELGAIPFGSDWTVRPSAPSQDWKSVVYGNGLFVAVASSGTGDRVMTSPDGITWTSRTTPADNDWSGVAYGAGLFVAVSNTGTLNRVMTSPDGITWTIRVSPAGDRGWISVTWGGGLFVAVSEDGPQQAMTSPNGIDWTPRTTPSGIGLNWRSVTYANGLFVAVSPLNSTGNVMTSPNGIDWTLRTTTVSTGWVKVIHAEGKFVASATTGSGSRIMISENGIDWRAPSTTVNDQWASLVYGDGIFLTISPNGQVASSYDAETWAEAPDAPNANLASAAAFGNNVFVIIGSGVPGASAATREGRSVWASCSFSDPASVGSQRIVLVGTRELGFYAFGRTAKAVAYASGETVSEESTAVQANNQVFIFRGTDKVPLRWDGLWGNEVELAPTPTPSAGFSVIPNSNQAVFFQNRLWVKQGKDYIAASDILDFTTFDEIYQTFSTNIGSSDFVVTTYPFGIETLIEFKNKSIYALQNCAGDLSDVVATEITRQVGAIGINSVVSVGPDLAYVSDRNINLMSLTSTNNAIQHRTVPLSQAIKSILDRVNWEYGYKISMAYWSNKLYVALPLDNATVCSSVVVYNFITQQWFGEWNFDSGLGMAIQGWQVGTYLGLPRLHAITEDGRIFVTDEGPNDISGNNVFEIATSLTTRPYRMDDNQKLTRRFWMDVSTNRPTFSVTAFSSGQGMETALVTDRSFLRSESWKWNDSAYSMDNSNDDYNRPWRKDYACLPSESAEPQSGFNPNALQNTRLPFIFRMKARLIHFNVTNTTGKILVNGIGMEATSGDRQSYPQVG